MIQELEEGIENLLESLPSKERFIIKRRLMDGSTLQAVANQLRCHRERVRQLERKALRRLRHPSSIIKAETLRELLGLSEQVEIPMFRKSDGPPIPPPEGMKWVPHKVARLKKQENQYETVFVEPTRPWALPYIADPVGLWDEFIGRRDLSFYESRPTYGPDVNGENVITRPWRLMDQIERKLVKVGFRNPSYGRFERVADGFETTIRFLSKHGVTTKFWLCVSKKKKTALKSFHKVYA